MTNNIRRGLAPLFLTGWWAGSVLGAVVPETHHPQEESYGVDVSFPIFHPVSTNYTGSRNKGAASDAPLQPLGDRQSVYKEHLDACRQANPKNEQWCDHYEYNRMMMNLRQPASMMNYTKQGFQKIKAPDDVVELVSKFWKQNHYKGQEEQWPPGNSYVNYWDAPTYLVSVDDQKLRGSGPELKRRIWEASAAILEEWMGGQELQPVSMYGIRVYGEGSIMLPHVDRLPLVASAMIPVAQNVDEPWPLEVYDHTDGKAHNITMEPGELFLFESASVIHGHPFPLKGEFVALLFIHFEPTGTTLRKDNSGVYQTGSKVDQQYKDNIAKGVGGPSASEDQINLPPYIKRESEEEEHWLKEHPKGWNPPTRILPTTAHLAAKTGNLARLIQELETSNDTTLLSQRDENGWQVLHEGVASGSKDIVELLVKHGANINSRTHGGYGETPLHIAQKWHGDGHPIVKYLRSLGALSLGPEL